MTRRLVLAALLFALPAAAAQAEVSLAPKFKPGSTWATNNTVETDQTMTINGMALETKAQQFFNVRAKVGKRSGDGDLPIAYHFESLQANLNLPGGLKVEYDSFDPPKEPAANDPLAVFNQLFTLLYKSKWTVVLDKQNDISDLKLTKPKDVTVPEIFKSMFSKKYFRQSMTQELTRMPAKPVSAGDTWERTESQELGGGQSLTITVEYKYIGETEKNNKKLHKVTGKVKKVKYVQDENEAGGAPVVTKSDLKAKSSDFVLLYDSKVGQIVDTRTSINLVGPLTMKIGQQEFAATLDLTIKMTSVYQP